jgi:H/ACA ribonucleoprotein complex subunit 1
MRGGFRGRGGDRGGRGGFERGGRGGRPGYDRDDSSPANVEAGQFVRIVEGAAVYRLTSAGGVVPLTQTFLFDARSRRVGRVKDVFGPLGEVYFSMEPGDGAPLGEPRPGDKVFAPADRLRAEAFFLADAPPRGRGGGRGGRGARGGLGPRGGGGDRGGREGFGPRGPERGGFSPRGRGGAGRGGGERGGRGQGRD